MRHILDRPIWNALSTSQSEFSIGGNLARRYLPEIGPLAAAADDSGRSLSALGELVPDTGTLILLQADPVLLPIGVVAVMSAPGVQMIGDQIQKISTENQGFIEVLEKRDIPQMVELAHLTKPGPFEMGTPRLGRFWGIREHGVLVAMAGERMKHNGFSEVSGVCVHPDYRGKGYARTLSAKVTSAILEGGQTPYLHVYESNISAIRLYESLGFRFRCRMFVAALAKEGPV